MNVVLWLVVLAVAFVGCRWSGRTLDHHYADRSELVAVVLIAVCVFAPLALGAAATLADGLTLKVTLAVAVCGGLFWGRERTAA